MQTIARANRRAPGKEAGLIVDYGNVFTTLEQALAIYAAEPKRGWDEDQPIRDKSELVSALLQAVEELQEFCHVRGVTLDDIKSAQGMDKIALLKDGVDKLIGSEEDKTFFARAAGRAAKLFKAILRPGPGSRLRRTAAPKQRRSSICGQDLVGPGSTPLLFAAALLFLALLAFAGFHRLEAHRT